MSNETIGSTERLVESTSSDVPNSVGNGSAIFEWMFAIPLPIVCFLIGSDVFGSQIELVYVFVGTEMALFAWWGVFPSRRPAVAAFAAGALIPGACFASIVGLVLLPLSVVALFFGIGVLGLVPLGTAMAFGRVATRAYSYAEPKLQTFVLVPMVFGAATALAPCVAAWATESCLVDSALSRLQRNEPDAVAESIDELRWLPGIAMHGFVDAYSETEDPSVRERLDTVYTALTHHSIETQLEWED